ncbi:nucleotidyltransferase family protein [Chitinophaga sp. Hz27]|uniref:nucleotidyltransferase family protein n=1 Tax=Chitinophaga sp. Hz27 TaxID=3347169 RepID=UPI0035DC200F
MTPTECIVLAGGLGTRLRDAVADKPKCMAPVGDQPFLYFLLQYLHRQGITHVILSLGYMAEQVIEWCNNNPQPVRISFATEPEPLGTGGGIMYALDKVEGDNIFIVNGDTYFDVNLPGLNSVHTSHHSNLSLALKPMTMFDRYGTVAINNKGQIFEFREKRFTVDMSLINGGIYITSASFLKSLGLPLKFSFEKEVLEPLAASKQLYGFVSDAYFIDIGIPDDYYAFVNKYEQ